MLAIALESGPLLLESAAARRADAASLYPGRPSRGRSVLLRWRLVHILLVRGSRSAVSPPSRVGVSTLATRTRDCRASFPSGHAGALL